MRQPCIDCGRPADGTRCPRHLQLHTAQRNRTETIRRQGGGVRRPYKGDYARRAAEVRATTVRCWLCGEGARRDDPWQADHVTAGDPQSELRGAHRSCNISRANKARSYRGE